MGDAECPFCGPVDAVAQNELTVAVRDRFPVAEGHTLVVTRRHVSDWWSATAAEREAILSLVDEVRADLDSRIPRPDGYNVGFNAGAAAGQTVPHLHVHVIPRYEGDVPDPRGGIRHVIPGKGNYLSPARAGARSAARTSTHAMGPDHADTAFLRRVLALLEDGAKVATYKPALLMALVDLSAEESAGRSPWAAVDIPVVDLADRVIELYWPQVQPQLAVHYRVHDGIQRLRQSTNDRIGAAAAGRRPSEARIPRAVARLQQRATGSSSPLQARLRHPVAWDQARREIAAGLARQPIPRLQRPGTASDDAFERFLYDDDGFGERVTEPAAAGMVVRLGPGVARRLADAAPVLRPAIEVVWTRQVARINRLSVLEESLRDQLFGVARVALRPVREAMMDAGTRTCFWCGRGLLSGRTQVDHVLPWAHYPIDSLYNLVLVDDACNVDKVDRPVTSRLLRRWLDRDPVHLETIAREIAWPVAHERTLRLAVTAYTDVPQGFPMWDGRGTPRGSMTDDERRNALTLLAAS